MRDPMDIVVTLSNNMHHKLCYNRIYYSTIALSVSRLRKKTENNIDKTSGMEYNK